MASQAAWVQEGDEGRETEWGCLLSLRGASVAGSVAGVSGCTRGQRENYLLLGSPALVNRGQSANPWPCYRRGHMLLLWVLLST